MSSNLDAKRDDFTFGVGTGKPLSRLVRQIDRFFLGMAVSIDNLTIGICHATGQPVPPGVRRLARKWRAE